jgi:hypothetical protein
VLIETSWAVRRFPPSSRDDRKDQLATQGGALVPVCPAVLEDKILPLLQNRGCRLPEEEVVQDDDVMGGKQILFTGYVDRKIRLCLVEVMKGDAFHRLDAQEQDTVDL